MNDRDGLRTRLSRLYAGAAAHNEPEPRESDVAAALRATGIKLNADKRRLLLVRTLERYPARALAAHLAPRVGAETQLASGFGVDHLDALGPAVWRLALEWLLTAEGYQLQPVDATERVVTWRGQREGRDVTIRAARMHEIAALGDADVTELTAGLEGMGVGARILVVTLPITAAACDEAARRQVTLVDRSAVAEMLARHTSAHATERERQAAESDSRAAAAADTRQRILAALRAMEPKSEPASKRSGRARATVRPAEALGSARAAFERLALVWETLVSDWTAAFGDRPARDGTLLITGEEDAFTELATRAEHLRDATAEVMKQLTATPDGGEPGYTAWRQAVMEEISGRAAAWRARVEAIDPARWNDFAKACPDSAAAAASRAALAADHATARADKAQGQLASPA